MNHFFHTGRMQGVHKQRIHTGLIFGFDFRVRAVHLELGQFTPQRTGGFVLPCRMVVVVDGEIIALVALLPPTTTGRIFVASVGIIGH